MRSVKLRRTFAVLNPARAVPLLIAQAKAVVAEIAANPTIFPSPNPPLATINTQIAALEVAQTDVLTRASGAVEARQVKVLDLTGSLHTARAYVEDRANLDPATAPATIKAAGLLVRKTPVRTKLDFVREPSPPAPPCQSRLGSMRSSGRGIVSVLMQ